MFNIVKRFGSKNGPLLVKPNPNATISRFFCSTTTFDPKIRDQRFTRTDLDYFNLINDNFALAENKINDAVQKGKPPSEYVYARLFRRMGDRVRNPAEYSAKTQLYLNQMRQNKIPIDTRVYNNILSYFSKHSDTGAVLNIINSMRRDGLKPDRSTYSEILRLVTSSGDLNGILTVMKDMNSVGIEPDEVNYVHIMEAFATSRKYDILDAIWQLVLKQKKAGLENYSIIITSYGYRNQPDLIIKTYDEAVANGHEDIGLWTSLLSALMRHHHTEKAEYYYKKMKDAGFEPILPIISSMVNGYGGVGNYQGVDYMFSELEKYHLKPDGILLTSTLRHPAEQGNSELVDKYWDLFVKKYNYEPQPKDYLRKATCYVKTNRMEDSLKTLQISVRTIHSDKLLFDYYMIYGLTFFSSQQSHPLFEKFKNIREKSEEGRLHLKDLQMLVEKLAQHHQVPVPQYKQ